MDSSIIAVAGTVLGVIVLVEAVALSGLTRHGVKMGQEWISPENVFLLVSDYVLALTMIYLLNFTESRLAICFAVGALGLTHLFRCVQRIVDMPRPFCATTPMILLNMAKLVFAAVLWGMCLNLGGSAPL